MLKYRGYITRNTDLRRVAMCEDKNLRCPCGDAHFFWTSCSLAVSGIEPWRAGMDVTRLYSA